MKFYSKVIFFTAVIESLHCANQKMVTNNLTVVIKHVFIIHVNKLGPNFFVVPMTMMPFLYGIFIHRRLIKFEDLLKNNNNSI